MSYDYNFLCIIMGSCQKMNQKSAKQERLTIISPEITEHMHL